MFFPYNCRHIWRGREKCGAIITPVGMSPPSVVPSETVADRRKSRRARRSTAHSLSVSSCEPWPPKAMTDATVKLDLVLLLASRVEP